MVVHTTSNSAMDSVSLDLDTCISSLSPQLPCFTSAANTYTTETSTPVELSASHKAEGILSSYRRFTSMVIDLFSDRYIASYFQDSESQMREKQYLMFLSSNHYPFVAVYKQKRLKREIRSLLDKSDEVRLRDKLFIVRRMFDLLECNEWFLSRYSKFQQVYICKILEFLSDDWDVCADFLWRVAQVRCEEHLADLLILRRRHDSNNTTTAATTSFGKRRMFLANHFRVLVAYTCIATVLFVSVPLALCLIAIALSLSWIPFVLGIGRWLQHRQVDQMLAHYGCIVQVPSCWHYGIVMAQIQHIPHKQWIHGELRGYFLSLLASPLHAKRDVVACALTHKWLWIVSVKYAVPMDLMLSGILPFL